MDANFYLQNPNELKKLCQNIFNQFDSNKDGEIDINEFKLALTKFATDSGSPTPDETVVKETMDELDLNKSKTLTIDEFENFVKKLLLSG